MRARTVLAARTTRFMETLLLSPGLVDGAGLTGQPRLKMLLGHAAEGAGSLDSDPHCRAGEIGKRDLFDLDDPHVVRVSSGRNRVFPRLVAGFRQRGGPPLGAEMEDPVHVAADRGDRGAD